ncbi:hypothetical protein ABZ671_01060 [Micromonospora sp. NPDC006766]|uniref:hypothetical protein n=1 Tax=Micromonospora sp. NPDC006766 TaxID=3154778 RepID=UPI0033FD275C
MTDPTTHTLALVDDDLAFTIDVPMIVTFHIAPDADLTSAINTIRDIGGTALDVDLGDEVTLHQADVMSQRRPRMTLIAGPCTDLHLRLDGFQEPAVCRGCREVYDQTADGSEQGRCGNCADQAENRRRTSSEHTEGDGCAIYDGGHMVTVAGAPVPVSALTPGVLFAEDGELRQVDATTAVPTGSTTIYHLELSSIADEEPSS